MDNNDGCDHNNTATGPKCCRHRRFVGLEDVAKLAENRRSKFIDRLTVSIKHVDLCSAAVHISR